MQLCTPIEMKLPLYHSFPESDLNFPEKAEISTLLQIKKRLSYLPLICQFRYLLNIHDAVHDAVHKCNHNYNTLLHLY